MAADLMEFCIVDCDFYEIESEMWLIGKIGIEWIINQSSLNKWKLVEILVVQLTNEFEKFESFSVFFFCIFGGYLEENMALIGWLCYQAEMYTGLICP